MLSNKMRKMELPPKNYFKILIVLYHSESERKAGENNAFIVRVYLNDNSGKN